MKIILKKDTEAMQNMISLLSENSNYNGVVNLVTDSKHKDYWLFETDIFVKIWMRGRNNDTGMYCVFGSLIGNVTLNRCSIF